MDKYLCMYSCIGGYYFKIVECVGSHAPPCVKLTKNYGLNDITREKKKTAHTHHTDTLTTCTRVDASYTTVEVRPVCYGPRSWGKLPAARHVTTNDATTVAAGCVRTRKHVAAIREIFLSVSPANEYNNNNNNTNNPFVKKKKIKKTPSW